MLTNLRLKNIHALPEGNSPTPVIRISIDEVSVQYTLIGLIRHGAQDFLKSYTLRNADIQVQPVAGSPEQKHDLASTLHGLIQQPALFSDRVDIENINLVAHLPDGDFALKGVNLLLDPTQAGELRIALLQVPRVRTWENLHATTTYARRDLIIRDLTLDPQIVIEKFELDASQRAQGINRLAVDGTFFGGSAEFSMFMQELGKNKANVKIESHLKDFSLEKVSKYFNAQTPALGSITDSSIELSGDPNVPASWTGSIVSSAGPLHAGAFTLDQISARVDAKAGTTTLNVALNTGRNTINVQAQCALPQTMDGFAGTNIDGTLTVAADELAKLSPQITGGNVAANGSFALKNKMLTAKFDATAGAIAGKNFGLDSATVHVTASKSLEDNSQQPAPFDGLQTGINASFAGIHAQDYAIDSGTLDVASHDARVQITQLNFNRDKSTISATGEYTLPRDMKSFATAPGSVKFSASVPSLAAFRTVPDLNQPNAQIEAGGNLSNGIDGYGGDVKLTVSNITYQDFSAKNLALDVTISHSVATIDALNFALNDTDGFSGTGRVDLRTPFVYDGKLQANLHDLSKFNALVKNMQGGLAGSLWLDWQGHGRVGDVQHSGNVQFMMSNGKAAGVQAINAKIAGSYSPELIDLPTFWITTSKGNLAATIGLKNNVLTIGQIAVTQAKKPLLTGSITLPLDLRNPKNIESIIPMNGPVSANISSADLAIDSFFPKDQAPARGTAKLTLTASGTIAQLDARVQLAVQKLQAKAAASLAPTNINFDARLVQDQLSLKGRIDQPAIKSIEIAGTLPLPVRQIIEQKKIDQNSPVQLSVRLPQSSVAFLTKVTPAIRYVEGTASVNVDVAGTIAHPDFAGSALLNLPAIRFTNQDLPAVSGFRGDIGFAKNKLTVNRLGGDISGGSVNVTGSVLFATLANPQIDLRMTSNEALLVRNESLTVRADSDLRVTGPLAGATVAGTIGITHSKFFRDIDILPIELPGRPAPKPPETTAGFSIDKPPLSNWKFDLAIKTKDPLKVRGNLANGAVVIDMKVVGTGRAPALDGSVRIENFIASLPFSKLEVRYGYVYFAPDEPFVPKLDIQGTSTMRDYNISVYIFGTASDPQTVFSSEPPLPQEDILALLATGTTVSELTGNADVLAGRAASLLFQKVYHKFFKSKEPSENESFISRFSVDLGGVDPKTGQQEVNTRFKIGENFYLIGDLDVGGNIRGEVKYLLRFR